jgi:hypothetical protein
MYLNLTVIVISVIIQQNDLIKIRIGILNI